MSFGSVSRLLLVAVQLLLLYYAAMLQRTQILNECTCNVCILLYFFDCFLYYYLLSSISVSAVMRFANVFLH